MKKNLKIILIILNLILGFLFFYNFILFKTTSWNLTFTLSVVASISTQLVCLSEFKIGKKLLFILLNILLTFISSLIEFLICGFIFPYSSPQTVALFATLIGISLLFINFTIFYTYLMLFINKLKEKEKPKSSFAKLLVFYPLIVIILESLILISANK